MGLRTGIYDLYLSGTVTWAQNPAAFSGYSLSVLVRPEVSTVLNTGSMPFASTVL